MDNVTLTGGTATFATKIVETGKTVTLAGATLAGTDAANYTLTSVATTTADITVRLLTVTATGINKVYDGNTIATVTLSDNRVSGDIFITTRTSNFASSNVGTAIPVSVTGISISGNDAPNYSLANTTASTTANITIASTTTTLITSAQSVRYMDNITFTAVIKPLNTGGILTGTVKFTIGLIDYGTANVVPIPGATDGSVQAMLITRMQRTEVPGSYTVLATFTSTNANYAGGTASKALTVIPRSATYTGTGFYTGDEFVWTPTETSSTGTVVLSATIKDANSPTGDVRGALVTFYYVNTVNGLTVYSAIPSASNLPVGLVDITDGSVGTASAIVQLNIGSQNAASYTIAVGVSGAYMNNKSQPTAIAVITVSKPVPGGYVVAGGSLLNKASAGLIKGATGLATRFSMDVKFNSSMTNPQGKSYIYFTSYYKPDGTLDQVEHKYEISSNAIATFAVGQPNVRQASFSSKANLVEVVDDATRVSIEGGAILQLSMWDAGTSGTNDMFGITLQRKAGGIWFSSNWNINKTENQLLQKGNVFVSTAPQTTPPPTTTARGGEMITAVIVKEKVVAEPTKFGLEVFGNPTATSFRVKASTDKPNDRITLTMLDMSGRLMEVRTNVMNGQLIEFGNQYRSGTYFVEARQGNNRKVIKLIKNN